MIRCSCGNSFEGFVKDDLGQQIDADLDCCEACQHNVSGFAPFKLVHPQKGGVSGSKVRMGVTYTFRSGKKKTIEVKFNSPVSTGEIGHRKFRQLKAKLALRLQAFEERWKAKGYRVEGFRVQEENDVERRESTET